MIMQFRRALWSLKNDPDQITYPGSDPESMVEELMKHYDKFFNIQTIPSKAVAQHREQMELQGVVVMDLNKNQAEINPNV